MSVTKKQSGHGSPARDEALARSVLYGVLSRALHYPTAELLREMQSAQTQDALSYAASLLGSLPPEEGTRADRAPAEDLPVELAARADRWARTFPWLTLESLLDWHGRLFGHTARGPVCPYETEYGAEALFQQPRQLARITGFYQAFGLTLRKGERERADHASCELEFLEFLSRKEAFALERQDEAMREETGTAMRLFLRDHLGRFGRAFARRLREQDPEGFFGRLGDFLADWLSCEYARLRIQPGAAGLPLRSAEDDQVPMACGEDSESDLVQLQSPSSKD